jgi:hypothetical protein
MTPEERANELIRSWHADSYPYTQIGFEGIEVLRRLIIELIAEFTARHGAQGDPATEGASPPYGAPANETPRRES